MKQRKKPSIPDVPAIPDETLARAFLGVFTTRDEANALAAFAFRNGPIENLHAGKSSPLTADPSLSRITDDEMREIMINASEMLAALLALRDSDPDKYRRFIQDYALKYCRSWNR